MRTCLLDKRTNRCVNIIELSNFETFVSVDPNLIVADRHDGEIGWILNGGEWESTGSNLPIVNQNDVVRAQRNKYLLITDKCLLPDFPLSEELKSAIITYRQLLRDLPDQSGFPDNIVWPEQPFDILR